MIDSEFKLFAYAEISNIGKSIGDPKRIELLDLLSQCPRNVETAAELVHCSLATASHHLQVLKQSRLVIHKKKGKYIYYEATEFGKEIWNHIAKSSEKYLPQIKSAIQDFFNNTDDYTEVNYRKLLSLVKTGKIILIDVRPEEEYHNKHFPGAISVPLKSLHKTINSLSTKIDIVAYCRGTYCVLSKNAITQLKEKGFKAFRLNQSVLDW